MVPQQSPLSDSKNEEELLIYHKVLEAVLPQPPESSPHTNPTLRSGTDRNGSIEPSHRVKLRQNHPNLRKAEKHLDTPLPQKMQDCILNSKAHGKYLANETAQLATQMSSQRFSPIHTPLPTMDHILTKHFPFCFGSTKG